MDHIDLLLCVLYNTKMVATHAINVLSVLAVLDTAVLVPLAWSYLYLTLRYLSMIISFAFCLLVIHLFVVCI